ncbi:hypothetical protein E2C01_013063 [Portunus trituberculatus]|uniref:Uncharacterized protein n=1 Tax=Portunus trituberculatus TaxID=210409 RepID=A0A5B7DFA9_PORTR|nr:hypothetical protein [Portunus trituberculatus]
MMNFPLNQAFRPNMLQPNMEKTETPSTVGGHMTTPLMPETKPVITTTTTTTTTSTTTTTTVPPSEPKKVPMTTLEPMADMEDETTLQPEPMAEVEADSVPQDQGTTEPIIEDEMMMEDTLAVADDKEEPVSATEIMPMMEGEEETATETFQDENEMVHNTEIQDDMTVTEPEPENEVTTEFPNLRDLPVF